MNKDYAESYKQDAREVAHMLSKLNEKKNSWEFAMNETKDNGDPYFDALTVLQEMGNLLASLVIYQEEYEADAEEQEPVKKGKKKC